MNHTTDVARAMSQPQTKRVPGKRAVNWVLGMFVAASLSVVGGASAQSASPDLIVGYRSIAGSLKVARASLATDPAGALSRIEAAQNAFRGLSSQLRSQQLIEGATQAFSSAKTAISRRSVPDLNAQITQITSILHRTLYDRYFTELTAARAASAKRYATALGSVLGLQKAAQASLNQATATNNAKRATSILENRVAEQIVGSLRKAQAPDRSVAFQNAVSAAGSFLIVQDSPRVGDMAVGEFTGAIQALTAGDTATFRSISLSLIGKTTAFASRARSMAGAAAPNPAPVVAAAPIKPVVKPAVKPAVQPTVKPAVKPVAAQTAPVTVQAAPVIKPQSAPTVAPTLGGTARQELIKAGVNAEDATTIATDLASQGYDSLQAATDALYVQLAEAQAHIQDGRVADARGYIDAAKTVFNRALQHPLDVVQPDLSARAARLFEASAGGSSLRSVDISVLMSETEAIRGAFKGQALSGLQGVIAAVQPLWLQLRGGLFLVIALVFAYPIYLLTLAFGGRNPYWRYIMIAMILLFIPPLLEGIAWLGSLLAQATGLSMFDGLSSLSILQNPLAQIAWAVMLLLTVVFATMGFYGIAQQFGLIRTRHEPAPAMTAMETTPAGGRMTGVARNPTDPGLSDKTVVEWDEEF
jgi:flagellin-specific chaperone FliS